MTFSLKNYNEHLSSWGVYSEAIQTELVSHVLTTPEGQVLIDPIMAEDEVLEAIAAMGKFDAIILLNEHHARDAVAFKERFGAPIYAPESSTDLSFAPDHTYKGDEELPGGVMTLHLGQPHPSESALLAMKILFVGDALVNVEQMGGLAFLPEPYCKDTRALTEAVMGLIVYEFNSIAVGHGEPIMDDADVQLAALLKV